MRWTCKGRRLSCSCEASPLLLITGTNTHRKRSLDCPARLNRFRIPLTRMPDARQYRHCGLLRHFADARQPEQRNSLPARVVLRNQVVNLKEPCKRRQAVKVDPETITSSDEGWGKKPLSNFNRRPNSAFEKRDPRACVGAAVPNSAISF